MFQRGVARNRKSTELYYGIGKVLQHKIGISDEATDYRRYFLSDPDPAYGGGPDPELNPDRRDNYLVAKDWFIESCVREFNRPQHILDRTLFRASPARCQFDYARGLQKDGNFGEPTREAWDLARLDWTQKFGKETVHAIMHGNVESEIYLEMTPEELEQTYTAPEDRMRIKEAVDQYQKIVNYRYWRMRAYAEAEHEMAEAHRSFFEAKQFFKNVEFDKAEAAAFSGMQAFDKIFKQEEYQGLVDEDTLTEECLLGWRIWSDIHQIEQRKIPEQFPLDWLVIQKQNNKTMIDQVEKEFNRIFSERR